MKEKFIRINITFIPSIEIVEIIKKLSKKISNKESSYFVIDNQNFFPHITIYSLEYLIKNLEKVFSQVEEFSKKLSAIKFVFKKITTKRGYVGIELDYTKELKNIHEILVRRLNGLREGHIDKKYIDSYGINFSEEKRKNIQKYGYPNLMSLYHPHMTITRLKNEQAAEKIAKKIEWTVKDFVVNKLGAYKMGENGTCVELLREFDLN
jgi:2'-5' RNA ligase